MNGVIALVVNILGWLLGKKIDSERIHAAWVAFVGAMELEGYMAQGSQQMAQAQKDALKAKDKGAA